MQIKTTRFGSVTISEDDLFLFPHGMIGFETDRHWALMVDSGHTGLGWLQSADSADLAFAVVSPRNCFPDYRVNLEQNQLAAIDLRSLNRAYVLNIVAKHQNQLTVNLRAPLLFNLDRRLACQVVTIDKQPLRSPWQLESAPLRKSA